MLDIESAPLRRQQRPAESPSRLPAHPVAQTHMRVAPAAPAVRPARDARADDLPAYANGPAGAPRPAAATSALRVCLARSVGDRTEAQQLRYQVFAQELGARIGDPNLAIDRDEFDDVCDHLLVREAHSGQVVGTYRMLPPGARRRLGRGYADAEFDLTRLAPLQASLVEVGRSCVHPDHRSGAVILMLWNGLAQYMRNGGHAHLIGCASASLADGGPQVAALYDRLQPHMVGAQYRVFPRHPYPQELILRAADPVIPPLIKGYLRLGARVCGDPAWDTVFNCADFLVWLPFADMQPRYARRFAMAGSAQPATVD